MFSRPQQTDPVTNYMRLRQFVNQQALQQQELQGAQLENQQRQIALEQSRALMDASKGVDLTKDDAFDTFLNQANATGKVSPQTVSAMSLQGAQYKEQLAKTDTSTLAAMKEAHNQLNGHIDALRGIADPAERSQAARDQANQILSNPDLVKHIEPQSQQLLRLMQSGPVCARG